MTKDELIQIFQDDDIFDKEFLKFLNIKQKKFATKRPDLYGFLLLDSLVALREDEYNSSEDIVSWAGHDEICLGIDLYELAAVATKEDVIDLIRCGIRYSSTYDSLAKFV